MSIIQKYILKKNSSKENIVHLFFQLIDEYKKNGKSKYFLELEDKLISARNAQFSLYVSINCNADANLKKHSKIILQANNPKFSLMFAKFTNFDVQKHGDVVYNSNNPYDNYQMALLPGSDIKKHEEVILNSQSPELSYLFAKNVANADILEHQFNVTTYGDAELMYYFAIDVKGCDVKALEKEILSYVPFNPYFASLFATRVPGANKFKIAHILKEYEKVSPDIEEQYFIIEEKIFPKQKNFVSQDFSLILDGLDDNYVVNSPFGSVVRNMQASNIISNNIN